jgi:hypothetical protein
MAVVSFAAIGYFHAAPVETPCVRGLHSSAAWRKPQFFDGVTS